MTEVLTGRRTAWLVALLPLLLAGALIGLLGEGEREARSTDTLPSGLDSTRAAELADALPDEDTSVALVLFSSETEIDGATLGDLRERASDLGRGVELVPAEDGTAALAVVPV